MGKQKSSGAAKQQQQQQQSQQQRQTQTKQQPQAQSRTAPVSAAPKHTAKGPVKSSAKSAASSSAAAAASAAGAASSQYRVEYKGWAPAGGGSDARVDEVDYPSLSPARFYVEYVAKRKPVLLRRFAHGGDGAAGAASEFGSLARDWTSPSFLRSRAGDASVRVEYKARGSGGSFGRGLHRWMPFKSFLKLLGCGGNGSGDGAPPVADDAAEAALLQQHASHALYLTSQPIDSGADGAPLSLCAEPLSSLLGPMPLRPALFEPLAPVQYNVWMGAYEDDGKGAATSATAAAAGSSSAAAAAAAAPAPAPRSSPYYRSAGTTSGLHHDFHDNAYLLLAGRKTFHLFPPSLAPCLYTHGMKPRAQGKGKKGKAAEQPRCTVRANGVIEYEGTEEGDEEAEGAGSDDADGASDGDESMSDEALSAAQERLARQMEADLADDSDEEDQADEDEEEEEEEQGEDAEEESEEEGDDENAEQDADSDDEAAAAAAAADEEARLLSISKRTAITGQLADLRHTHSSLQLNLRVSAGIVAAGGASPAEHKRHKNLSTEAANIERKIAAIEARLAKVDKDEAERLVQVEQRLEREAEEATARAAARAAAGGSDAEEEQAEEQDDSDDDGDIDLSNLRDDYVDEEGEEEGEEEDEEEDDAPSKPGMQKLPRSAAGGRRSFGHDDMDDDEEEEEEEDEDDDEDEEIDPAEREAWKQFMAAAEEAQKRKKENKAAGKGKNKHTEQPAAAAAASDSGSRKRKEPAAASAAAPAAASKKVKTSSGAASPAAAASPAPLPLSPSQERFPSNFSRLDFATLSPAEMRAQFPLFSANNACVPLVVEVRQGDMLYLPASWFHEVFSAGHSDSGSDGNEETDAIPSSSPSDSSSLPPSVHMALNYWFAPPSASGSYTRPYDAEDAHHLKRWKTKYAPQAEAAKRDARIRGDSMDRERQQPQQQQQQQRKGVQAKSAAKVTPKPAVIGASSNKAKAKAPSRVAAPAASAVAASSTKANKTKSKGKAKASQ